MIPKFDFDRVAFEFKHMTLNGFKAVVQNGKVIPFKIWPYQQVLHRLGTSPSEEEPVHRLSIDANRMLVKCKELLPNEPLDFRIPTTNGVVFVGKLILVGGFTISSHSSFSGYENPKFTCISYSKEAVT
ncbi:hypothetical protein D3C74_49840 [compost metagenome]